MVIININGIPTPQIVLHTRPDGQCLFYSLANVVHGTESWGFEVRKRVVNHVANNWSVFQPYTIKTSGDIYGVYLKCSEIFQEVIPWMDIKKKCPIKVTHNDSIMERTLQGLPLHHAVAVKLGKYDNIFCESWIYRRRMNLYIKQLAIFHPENSNSKVTMTNGQCIKFEPGESDYDSDESPNSRAFAVSPSTVCGDLSVPPMGGEQYLCRVMNEAKKSAGVVVVNIGKIPQRHTQLPAMPEKVLCNSNLLPSKDWQVSAMADFSKLRLNMEKLRQKLESDNAFTTFTNSLPRTNDEEQWLKIVLQEGSHVETNHVGPSTRLCLAVSQVTLWHLLGMFRDWLNDKDVSVPVGCRWVYCLLACLEHPIPPEVYFTFRQIARTLINYRAQIESVESEELPHINLLVCIIGRYFNQTDLADP